MKIFFPKTLQMWISKLIGLQDAFEAPERPKEPTPTSIGRVERTEESLWFEIHGWPPDPGLNWGELTPTNYGL